MSNASSDPRKQLGDEGERRAARHLRSLGLKILAQHFLTPAGELDLIARDGKTIVFVEVKTRRDRRWSEPQDAVTPEKQRRLTRAAGWYLNQRGWLDRPCRFDVIAIILPATGEPELRHIPAAFAVDRW